MNYLSFKISYDLLIYDFKTLIQYVHPIEDNYLTYSHRIFELLLRVCTEFENVSKEQLIIDGYNKPLDKMNIKDFEKLNNKFNLSEEYILLKFLDNKNKFIQPFSDWNIQDRKLKWYSSYNNVKHNRTKNFNDANFKNLIYSIGGLTLMCYKIWGFSFFNETTQSKALIKINDKDYYECRFFDNSGFTVCTRDA